MCIRDRNNREPFPWNDKLNWNNDLKEITSTLMNLKNSNSILKYGTFELIPSTKGAVAFRRVLKDESLICIFNRDSVIENFKILKNSSKRKVFLRVKLTKKLEKKFLFLILDQRMIGKNY